MSYFLLLLQYISHPSIPKYYISRGITRIFSLPEGYKGKYDPYFPPSGYYFDQSEPLFSSHKQSHHHTYYMCYCSLHHGCIHTILCIGSRHCLHRHGNTRTLIDTNQESISYHSIWQFYHVASSTASELY